MTPEVSEAGMEETLSLEETSGHTRHVGTKAEMPKDPQTQG